MKKTLLFALLSMMTILVGLASCSGDDDVAVTGIKLDRTEITLLKGESCLLRAIISPENATGTSVTWNSSNPSVATVDGTGKVTAIEGGTTTVTITTTDGKFSATCIVNVNVNVSSLTLSDTSLSLEKGTSKKLSVTVNPDDATDKSVKWSSADTNIATVDENGNVTAVNGGTTTITVKSADGKISATCAVVVTVSVQSVVLDKTEVSLVKGQTMTLIATISPSDATTKEMIWSTSDEHIVTVDNGNIKAVGVGTATISVTTKDGSKVATCTVTVDKSENIGYHPYGDGQQW